MEQAEFLKKIIDLAFDYLAQHPSSPTLPGFSGFLAQRLEPDRAAETADSGKMSSETDDLGIRLVLLNRYAKEYVKMALESTELQTADEFSFLIMLLAEGSHTKSELIHKMVLSKTSGAEVLKRLLRKGLIEQYDDPEDGRSKRVEITESGQQLVRRLLPRMSQVSRLVRGNLSTTELQSTNYLLKKLHRHHREVFENSSREEMAATLQPDSGSVG